MSITRSSLSSIPTSFATVPLGTTNDPLPTKLEIISAAGFQAIELGFPDLVSFASKFHNKDIKEDDYTNLCSAGVEVKKLCKKNGLKVLMLQPFANFEGWPDESEERHEAFGRAQGWLRVMEAVGTDMLQVGSSDSPSITGDLDILARDLRQLCILLGAHGYRVAYENWCWATHAPTWREVWEIVKRVDRENIGLCLDTFQTAGGEWADPTTKSGLVENRGGPEQLTEEFRKSLEEMSRTIPPEKIYLLQISDAYKLKEPMAQEADESGLRPRGRWSHDFRPVPFNGGYLPVVDVAKAVLKTGTRCWFSMEVFDGGPDGRGGMKYDLEKFAREAMESHKKLIDACADD